MDIQSELIKTIEMMINKAIENNNGVTVIPSVVQDIDADDENYLVNLNGNTSWVKCGTDITPTVGMGVWVCIPQGNIANAFILAKK